MNQYSFWLNLFNFASYSIYQFFIELPVVPTGTNSDLFFSSLILVMYGIGFTPCSWRGNSRNINEKNYILHGFSILQASAVQLQLTCQ